jgi:nitrous oxidase accessory protein NosD
MTIQNDIDIALPGATVNVAPGTYNEQLIINKPLTLSGPTPGIGEAVIDAAGLTAGEPTIHVLADNVTVENLTLQNGPGQGIRAGNASFPGLTGVIIRNNIIKDHDLAGVLTANSASMLIEDNTIIDNGKATGFQRVGVYLYPHGETHIRRNIIKNNFGDGIFARESNAGLLIEENEIENHNSSGVTLAWDEINVIIRDNQIFSCGAGTLEEQGGIVIVQSRAEVITGNTVQHCNPYGIHWGWTPTSGSAPSQILIAGNIITNAAGDGIFLFSQGPGGFISPDPFPLEPDVLDNQLLDNGRAGIYISNFYYYSPGNAHPEIHGNDIVGNAQFGVFNGTAKEVDATGNWWGSSSGPFHPILNPGGTGDPVSDHVLFNPWETIPQPHAMDCLVAEKVFDQCFREEIVIKNFKVPAEFYGSGRGADLTRISRAECSVLDSRCKIVDISPPTNGNCRTVTLKPELEMKINLIADTPALNTILCSFRTTVDDFFSQVQLYIPPPGVVFGPDGGPFLCSEFMNATCTCRFETPFPGEPVKTVICTTKICLILEVSAFVRLLVPHFGICTPGPCGTVFPQKETKCPSAGRLYPQ